MNDLAVSIRHLNKTYKVYDTPTQRARGLLFHSKIGRDFVALDDINVDIKRGEAFAIVGKNGSGKSTMLQILASILKPTLGEVQVKGRIAALLELGSGFDPESTGYENIYMNAAILGLSKERIEKKIQEIIEFADIGHHLYEPVKTYSSGMYVRLGFAVAINVDAEILLVDEALAVGDVFFRQRCYSRLNELKEKGTTIILVTHNMSEVEQFCDRAMLLQNGRVIVVGNSCDVVKQYYILNDSNNSTKNLELNTKNEPIHSKDNGIPAFFDSTWQMKQNVYFDMSYVTQISNGKASFARVGLFDEEGNVKRVFQQGEKGYFYLEIEVKDDINIPNAGVLLRDQKGNLVHGKDTLQMDAILPTKVQGGKIIYYLQCIRFDLEVGEYTVSVGFGSIAEKDYSRRNYLLQEELNDKIEHICDANNVGTFSVIVKNVGTPTRMAFYGNCDLPEKGELFVG